ncbi:hypothetical protein [Dyadobacter arcticus]|uniref:Lipoprotein n=1 Tax=Dyadobacter arcticus TaxID=1078754 RepID=A0ABX0UKK1_9BACT|nr:hypothetical protein [Dyadobacter arcticus]NIJ53524.1 hypothetical protein [Dyadobacter arcticus]
MKLKTPKFAAICCLVFLIFSCSENESNETDKEFQFRKEQLEFDNEMFPVYDLGNVKQHQLVRMESEQSAKERLRKFNPIEVPSTISGTSLISRWKAINLYKAFAYLHSSDTIMIRQFRSNYAKLVLTTYDVLEKGNYSDITYFTRELIESETGRFKLILKGLQKIKGNCEPRVYDNLVLTTQKQIDINIEHLKISKRNLPVLLQKLKDGQLDIGENMRKEFIAAISRADNLSTKLAKLEKHHQEIANL